MTFPARSRRPTSRRASGCPSGPVYNRHRLDFGCVPLRIRGAQRPPGQGVCLHRQRHGARHARSRHGCTVTTDTSLPMALLCGLSPHPRSSETSRRSLLVARRSDSYSPTRGLAQPVFSRSFVLSLTEFPHSTRIGPGRFLTSPRCSDAGAFSRLRRDSSDAQPSRRAAVRPAPGLHAVQ